MKDYIEVTNKNEEKPCRTLLRKDAVIGVDEREEGSRLVIIADDGAKKCILYSATSYDEIKEALSNEEWAKKTAQRVMHELQVIIAREGSTAEIYEAFERRLTEILKGED